MMLKHSKLLLRVRPGTSDETKQAIVARWYREQIKVAMPDLIVNWEPKMGVTVERFFVRQMKTKWGSCNPGKRSIRLNTDLAKKPLQCLEYIVVHEMAHLLVRRHNDQFSNLMDSACQTGRFYDRPSMQCRLPTQIGIIELK